MYITGENSGSDFAFLSQDNGLKSNFSQAEKDENVKTAFEGIIASTPESVIVKNEREEKIAVKQQVNLSFPLFVVICCSRRWKVLTTRNRLCGETGDRCGKLLFDLPFCCLHFHQ